MKRKHDIDTNTNQDGCKAVIPEDYSRQKAAKIQEHETDSTLITKQKVKPILIGGVSVMDGAVILSILKSALLQEPALSYIMSFGVALPAARMRNEACSLQASSVLSRGAR